MFDFNFEKVVKVAKNSGKKIVKLLGLKTITGEELDSLMKMSNKKMKANLLKDLAKKEKSKQNDDEMIKAILELM